MTQRATKRNLFGFGRKQDIDAKPAGKCALRSSLTIGESTAAAYEAGKRSGDTGLFKQWLCSKGLQSRGNVLVKRLRAEYNRGVEGEPSTGLSKVVSSKTPSKSSAPGLSEVQRDVVSALVGQGMKATEAKEKARSQYQSGDTFDTLFRKIAGRKNPMKKSKLRTIRVNPCGSTKNESYRKTKKQVRKYQRAARLEAGPMFQKWRKATKTSKTGKLKSNPRVATLKQGKSKAEIFKPLFGGAYKVVITKGGQVITESFKALDGALAWARLKLYEVATAGNPVKNPLSEANRVFEEFHGLPSKEIVEYIEQEHHHSVTSGIGTLVSLNVLTDDGKRAVLDAPDPDGKNAVMVSTSEDGRQLFFKRGDQSVNLGALGLNGEDKRDHMTLGRIERIVYRTRKSFERGGKEDIDFNHKFKTPMPVLAYFPRNPGTKMKVFGGHYSIAPPRKDLKGVSPGIIR